MSQKSAKQVKNQPLKTGNQDSDSGQESRKQDKELATIDLR